MSYEEFEKNFKKLDEDLINSFYSKPKNKIIQDDITPIEDDTPNQNQNEVNKTGYSFSKSKIIQDDVVTIKDNTQNQNKNNKQIKTTNLLQDILKNCKNIIKKICNVFSQHNTNPTTKEQIYNRFIDLRETYYDINTSDKSTMFKLKAYLIYAINSTKILWQLGSAKERFILVLGIIANVLSKIAKFIAISTIVLSVAYLIVNAILFLIFFVDKFHLFPEVSKFLCTWLPSGMQPSDNFFIGYTRMIAWGLTAVIMFPLWCGFKRVFDSYEECQENKNNDVQTKIMNAIRFILAVILLATLLLGLIWFLCFYMNLSTWTWLMKKTAIYTSILGLIGLGILFSNGGNSVDTKEFIAILIPKSWFDK